MSTRPRRLWITALEGFSSALPLALTGGTLQAYLATEKINIQTIGWFSLIGLPYTWKFVWAPLLDQYSPFRFKNDTHASKRAWMLLFQLALVITLFTWSFITPQSNLALFGVFGFLTTLLSANQDIVIDGYRTEILLPEERGLGSAAVNFGARTAHLLAGAGALIAADHFSWQIIYRISCIGIFVGIAATLLAPTPTKTPASIHKPTFHDWFITPFKELLGRPKIAFVIGFILIYKLGDAFTVALQTVFLMSKGFTKSEIGAISKGIGMGASLLGSAAGGYFLFRIGTYRSLFYYGILQAVANLGFWFLAITATPTLTHLTFVIFSDNFTTGMSSTAYIAFLTGLCHPKFSGTHFALLTSLFAFARVFIGGPAGYAAVHMGWPHYFILGLILALPGLVLLRMKQTVFDQT